MWWLFTCRVAKLVADSILQSARPQDECSSPFVRGCLCMARPAHSHSTTPPILRSLARRFALPSAVYFLCMTVTTIPMWWLFTCRVAKLVADSILQSARPQDECSSPFVHGCLCMARPAHSHSTTPPILHSLARWFAFSSAVYFLRMAITAIPTGGLHTFRVAKLVADSIIQSARPQNQSSSPLAEPISRNTEIHNRDTPDLHAVAIKSQSQKHIQISTPNKTYW